jgi:pimeloyl-ACP methyl ester carboxylesterase
MTVEHSALAFASANGITIAYDTFGSPEQEPLVLIMGLSSQMILWEEDFCTRLAARVFFVIRFDNLDVGLSTRFSRAGLPHINALLSGKIRGASAVPYTIADMALDAVGLLDALGVKSAHVVGESMGGMIGQEMAIRYPERTRTLASIMSTTGNPLLPPPRQEALEILFRPVPLDREGFVRYFREVWTILSGPRYSMDDERALHLGHETFSRGIEPAGSARQFAAIIASGSRKERPPGSRRPHWSCTAIWTPSCPWSAGSTPPRPSPALSSWSWRAWDTICRPSCGGDHRRHRRQCSQAWASVDSRGSRGLDSDREGDYGKGSTTDGAH